MVANNGAINLSVVIMYSIVDSILFHKISVSIECCILPTSGQYKSGAQTPNLPFQLLTPLQSGGKNGRG